MRLLLRSVLRLLPRLPLQLLLLLLLLLPLLRLLALRRLAATTAVAAAAAAAVFLLLRCRLLPIDGRRRQPTCAGEARATAEAAH
jgi:hypothetical protein